MISYPTLEDVRTANRKQIYRWFLLLKIPGFSKWDKKTGTWIQDPTVPLNAQEILDLIYKRWQEFGGRDFKISAEIMKEAYGVSPARSSQG